MTKFTNTKNLLLITAVLVSQLTFAFAQKLPKVQTAGIWAPSDIKIDGKTTEWNDQFQAHNFGNHIYYTLSNDDKNLYLTARMDDKAGTQKIFKGGLTLTIIPLDKKENKIAITFPLISKSKRDAMEDGGDTRLIDSLKSTATSELTKDYKEIYVTGIPGIDDPLISIYNAQGIRVGASFDKKMNYTYELAIPLKYLEVAINSVKSIKYKITLNVLPVNSPKRVPTGQGMVVTFPQPAYRPPSIDDMFRYDDSDFSGLYTLASKP